MSVKSASYKECYCGADCYLDFQSTVSKPCWGEVSAIDEETTEDGDWFYVHACEGHLEGVNAYTPETL